MAIAWELTMASLATIALYTMLWRYNPAFKFIEHTIIGTTLGYTLVLGIRAFDSTGWTPLVKGNTALIVPIVIGALLLARLHRPYAWVGRWPLALMIGTGMGVAVRAAIGAQFVAQLRGMFRPLVGVSGVDAFNTIAELILVISVLTVFVFVAVGGRGGGTFARVQRFGRVAIMIAFGAALAAAIMTRTVFGISTVHRLLVLWLGIGA